MMISPESYLSEHKNDTFEELIKERDSLIEDIRELEKLVYTEDRSSEEWRFNPGPDVRYQMDLDYLSKLCEFISQKYCCEVVHADDDYEDEEDADGTV